MLPYLASHWVVFLIAAAVSYVLAVVVQLINMKRLMSNGEHSVFVLFFIAAVFAISGTINGILFIIGVIMAIIQTVKS
jgi:hypothetical protein